VLLPLRWTSATAQELVASVRIVEVSRPRALRAHDAQELQAGFAGEYKRRAG
jgi:hypothetical protein